jgi:hypothetical protein
MWLRKVRRARTAGCTVLSCRRQTAHTEKRVLCRTASLRHVNASDVAAANSARQRLTPWNRCCATPRARSNTRSTVPKARVHWRSNCSSLASQASGLKRSQGAVSDTHLSKQGAVSDTHLSKQEEVRQSPFGWGKWGSGGLDHEVARAISCRGFLFTTGQCCRAKLRELDGGGKHGPTRRRQILA